MSASGQIVGGFLAPHPPHLVYAENPPQNEPTGECGWEPVRWAYERLRQRLEQVDFDVIVVLSAHWQTYVGTHFLCVPQMKGLSIDPIFPNLFRYHYDLKVDCELATLLHNEAQSASLISTLMQEPKFRVDYGTLVSCHMSRPAWDIPIVSISSNRSAAYYSIEVMQEQAIALGRATKAAIAKSGRKALLLASNSLSHRHFTTSPEVIEDMSCEHIYNHQQYLWDMRLIELMRTGQSQDILHMMPEFIEQSVSEADAGGLSWLISAMDVPHYNAEFFGYGTVIGTGNAVIGWLPGKTGGQS